MADYYLSHHGTKGMRWGVRRYQNKDGSLTNAGKKRYARELEKVKKAEKVLKNKQKTQAKLDDLERRKKAVEEQNKAAKKSKKHNDEDKIEKPKKKRIKDMTTEELNERIARLQLEKNCRDLEASQATKGKQFATMVKNDIVSPGLKDVSKQMFKSVAVITGNEVMKRVADAWGFDDNDHTDYRVYTNNKKKN